MLLYFKATAKAALRLSEAMYGRVHELSVHVREEELHGFGGGLPEEGEHPAA